MTKKAQQNPISIAIVGLGSAGKSRLRAIENIEELKLAAMVSRRSGIGNQSWREVLQDASIKAVAISTENTDHASRVHEALLADKHVLCDYPLCFSKGEAKTLYDLAKAKSLVLHTEHIALLSAEHNQVKNSLQVLGQVCRGDYLFQGGWNQKLFDSSRTGPYPFLAISRLMQVSNWLGEFEIELRRYEADSIHFRLHLHLLFPGGGILGFTEERHSGLPRRRSFAIECERGNFAWQGAAMQGGLFEKDLRWFYERIALGKSCYYDEQAMIRLLGELEKVR